MPCRFQAFFFLFCIYFSYIFKVAAQLLYRGLQQTTVIVLQYNLQYIEQ